MQNFPEKITNCCLVLILVVTVLVLNFGAQFGYFLEPNEVLTFQELMRKMKL